jgi:hypothetical protein
MGNSRWRLETSVNLAILHAKEANFLNYLEIIISDWGSEIPLSEVLSLVPEAETIVKFIHVPCEIALKQQKDSKFPEVVALNVAARRSKGEYIGRIDNDTVVGPDFYRKFKRLYDNNPTPELDLADSFLFVERKSVPYRISRISLSLFQIKGFISTFNNFFKLETATEWGKEFWCSPVGIMMLHRDLWEATQGYDERLIYWGWMEGDLALRAGQKHNVVKFSKYVGHDFYHLEHYSNLTEYKDRNGTATPRKKNKIKYDNLNYKENSSSWGLTGNDLRQDFYNFKNSSSVNPITGYFKLSFALFLLFKDKTSEFLIRTIPRARIFIGKNNPFK